MGHTEYAQEHYLMKYKYLSGTVFLLLSGHLYAMFCPTNFSQINTGDTIEHVIQVCGNPESQNSHKKTTSLSEEWIYYVKTQSNVNTTSKMKVIFSNNKVVNISVESNNPVQPDVWQSGKNQPVVNINFNNQRPVNVSSTNACGPTISIGQDVQQVKYICGTPAFVKQNQSPDAQSTSKVTELRYGGPNPATLIFENGILKDRQT